MGVTVSVQRVVIAAGLGAGTVAALTGVLLLGPLGSSLLLTVVFLIVWPLAAVIRQVVDDTPDYSAVSVAAYAAVGVLCLPGLVRLVADGAFGVATLLVGAVLLALIDLVVPDRPDRPSRRQRRVRQLTEEQFLEDEALIASLQCPLSISELCDVWVETAGQLAMGADMRDRQAVAEVRRICLDEFERRNPVGFQRWLDAGAPPDPTSYLMARGS
ncbi:hypothetical protein E1263_33495 [Kribbella antibiotica]|uniref:Uncharacterized protein n=1 Tax=Kribbella antibiotica TaxID=190195 RepID=A0A4R4YSP1_9ACTN|nr:hypothetical protein E1263_33495 [Kribbella antibiotica]